MACLFPKPFSIALDLDDAKRQRALLPQCSGSIHQSMYILFYHEVVCRFKTPGNCTSWGCIQKQEINYKKVRSSNLSKNECKFCPGFGIHTLVKSSINPSLIHVIFFAHALHRNKVN